MAQVQPIIGQSGVVRKCTHSNHYRVATLFVMTFATLTTLFLLGQHQWNVARYRVALQRFFSTNLGMKVTLVTLVGLTTLAAPYFIAYTLAYQCGRLKTKTLERLPQEAVPQELELAITRLLQHNGSRWLSNESGLRESLRNHPQQEQLLTILNQIMIEDFDADPEKVLETLSRVVSVAEDGELENPHIAALLQARARQQIEMAQIQPSPSARGCIFSILYRLRAGTINVIDALTGMLGWANICGITNDEAHVLTKAQQLGVIIQAGLMLVTVLSAIYGGKTAAIVVGLFLGIPGIFSFIWPHIKPTPDQVPGGGRNLTIESLPDVPYFNARSEELGDAVIKAFRANKHAMIIGHSGVGKSQFLMEELPKMLALQENSLYPDFAGKKIFHWNAATLIRDPSFMGSTDILSSILTKVGAQNIEDVIIFIDEVHTLHLAPKLLEQLKSYLDKGYFKYVIVASTPKEFEAYLEPNAALIRRFEEIGINDTDEEETIEALQVDLLRDNPTIVFSKRMLREIYAASNTLPGPQPLKAKSLLANIIQNISGQSGAEQQENKRNLRAIRSAIRENLSETEDEDLAAAAEAYANALQQQANLQVRRDEKQQELNKLARARMLLHKIRQKKNQLLANGLKPSSRNYYFLLKKVEENTKLYIQEKSRALGVDYEITSDLIRMAAMEEKLKLGLLLTEDAQGIDVLQEKLGRRQPLSAKALSVVTKKLTAAQVPQEMIIAINAKLRVGVPLEQNELDALGPAICQPPGPPLDDELPPMPPED